MTRKSIYTKWILNVMSVVLFVAVTLMLICILLIQGYVYNGISSTLDASSLQLMNYFDDNITSYEFSSSARNYVESFPNKHLMEVMVLNSKGEITVSSTGFAPDNNEKRPDCDSALIDPDGYGIWKGKLSSGEKVMAITRMQKNDNGTIVGGIRYMVSLEKADHRVKSLVSVAFIIAFILLSVIVLSSLYFLKAILNPIKEISEAANRISKGNFSVRIEKRGEDEIGDLCDTINDMAMELSASNKLKNDFISSISHELRTPLTAIKGWAETMQGDTTVPPTYEKGLNVISREAGRLSSMVEELLDFSRLQQGNMVLFKTKIDIIAEVGDAVYMFNERVKTEEKYLLYDEPNEIYTVIGDINRLRQVFVNIIDNAIKYTGKGGTISVNVGSTEGYVHIVVSDNGCGISAEHLPRIKEKFYKANHAVRGSGIGLALADEIVTAHGGTLDIESHENVGTAVTISLPLSSSNEEVGEKDELNE